MKKDYESPMFDYVAIYMESIMNMTGSDLGDAAHGGTGDDGGFGGGD